MRRQVITNIITLLFTATFLVPRVANLHALSHLSDDDEPISCELCDIISNSHQFDLITNDTYCFEDTQINIPSSFVIFTQYNTPKEKIASPISIYNKPPPVFSGIFLLS
ncbi:MULTISPECIES: hypothetical protein [Aquimarina]|uniref:Uncharacterized protein n=1 Tax=Aquimarina algiphila TaxID=2047982 RepID=A0A554VJK8_9FLAO|nr:MULTISPECIES: hypothetical protein [Aquimarina]TSE08103.1 hypothetical protein FOF46_13680 [Aquimarina algiphila]